MTNVAGECWLTVQGERGNGWSSQPVRALRVVNVTQKRPTRLGTDQTCIKIKLEMDQEIFDPTAPHVTISIPLSSAPPVVASYDADASKVP